MGLPTNARPPRWGFVPTAPITSTPPISHKHTIYTTYPHTTHTEHTHTPAGVSCFPPISQSHRFKGLISSYFPALQTPTASYCPRSKDQSPRWRPKATRMDGPPAAPSASLSWSLWVPQTRPFHGKAFSPTLQPAASATHAPPHSACELLLVRKISASHTAVSIRIPCKAAQTATAGPSAGPRCRGGAENAPG